MATTAKQDPREVVEQLIDEGCTLDEAQKEIERLVVAGEDRDALWVWARAYYELRPASIFEDPEKPAEEK